MAKQDTAPDVHVDLLEIDMTTGVNWLHPTQRDAGKPEIEAIRKRNRDKWLAEHFGVGPQAKAFDPSEPRDEHGRWTEGGGSGGESEGQGSAPAGDIDTAWRKLKDDGVPMLLTPKQDDHGFLFPDGDTVSTYVGGHEIAARDAGTTVDALLKNGTATMEIHKEGQRIGVYAPQPLTTLQVNTILNAISDNEFHRFYLETGRSKDHSGSASADPLTVEEANDLIKSVYPKLAPAPKEPSGGERPPSYAGGELEHTETIPFAELLRREEKEFRASETNDTYFPKLNSNNSHVVGPSSDQFNCIGYAMGDTSRWWWPVGSMSFWPKFARDGSNIRSFDHLLIDHAKGSEIEDARAWNKNEKGFVRLALYAEDASNMPTHLARMSPQGKWVSKIGGNVLLEHNRLEDLADGEYGHVEKVYRVPEAEWRKLSGLHA